MTDDLNNPTPSADPAPNTPLPPSINHARRNAWILVVLVIVVTFMLLAPRLVKDKPMSTITSDPKGQAAPDFVLKDIQGNTVRLSDYRGKAVVVNFWATWCPPCKTEMPWLVDLENKYRSQGLEIIGVALDEASNDEIAKFARNMKLNYSVVIGDDNTADAYGNVQMLPTTFYIDRSGTIVERVVGITGRGEIEDYMKEALAGKGASQAASTKTTPGESQ
jgi:cytochrome c biogenesis protein CcmG/thiol:disulfide interchange protein DsbE